MQRTQSNSLVRVWHNQILENNKWSESIKSSLSAVVLGLFGHSGDDEVRTEGTKEMLDDMHKRKIDMADEIYVINVGGYIGSSTRSEIEYAYATGKGVRYMEPQENL